MTESRKLRGDLDERIAEYAHLKQTADAASPDELARARIVIAEMEASLWVLESIEKCRRAMGLPGDKVQEEKLRKIRSAMGTVGDLHK